MKITASSATLKPVFWTWRKKLLLLALIFFITFMDYWLRNCGNVLEYYARYEHHFNLPGILSYAWSTDVRISDYFLAMAPFLLGYFFWWRKPNVARALLPCLYLLFFGYFCANMFRLFYSYGPWWGSVMNVNPDYISQIPAWLRFLFLN